MTNYLAEELRQIVASLVVRGRQLTADGLTYEVQDALQVADQCAAYIRDGSRPGVGEAAGGEANPVVTRRIGRDG